MLHRLKNSPQKGKEHAQVPFNVSSLTLTLSNAHQASYKSERRLAKENIFLFFTDLRTLGVPFEMVKTVAPSSNPKCFFWEVDYAGTIVLIAL